MILTEHIDALNSAMTGSDIRYPLVNAFRELYETGRDAEYIVGGNGIQYVAEGQATNGEAELKLRHGLDGSPNSFENIIPLDNAPKPKSKKLVKSNGIYSMIGDLESLRRLLPNV